MQYLYIGTGTILLQRAFSSLSNTYTEIHGNTSTVQFVAESRKEIFHTRAD